MAILRLKFDQLPNDEGVSMETSEFDQLHSSLLGISARSSNTESFEALAVVFDLEDFTSFCNQPGYSSLLPEYVSKFSKWLFERISEDLIWSRQGTLTTLCGPPPFYAKFLGDGFLFLWDISLSGPKSIGKIVLMLWHICEKYKTAFLPIIKPHLGVSRTDSEGKGVIVPEVLRCGIARGPIHSIGDKEDYVGQCINIAARLQKVQIEGLESPRQARKVKKFSFAFWKIGFFELESYFGNDEKLFRLIHTPIRGFRQKEPVWVLTEEFGALTVQERKTLRP